MRLAAWSAIPNLCQRAARLLKRTLGFSEGHASRAVFQDVCERVSICWIELDRGRSLQEMRTDWSEVLWTLTLRTNG